MPNDVKPFTEEEIAERENHASLTSLPPYVGYEGYWAACMRLQSTDLQYQHDVERRWIATVRERDARIVSQTKRLAGIAYIIEGVDSRCMAADGPVTATMDEMTQAEISKIYKLAQGPK